MQRNRREGERLTDDEIARRKLGPRGVPGGEYSAKMTPQQEKNILKEGEFDPLVGVILHDPTPGEAVRVGAPLSAKPR